MYCHPLRQKTRHSNISPHFINFEWLSSDKPNVTKLICYRVMAHKTQASVGIQTMMAREFRSKSKF